MTIENIKKIMKRKNIGNKELAEKSGVPLGTLNKIIYGDTPNPSVDTVKAIARALNCSLDELLEESSTEHHGYYLDSDSAKMAQEIYENPKLKLLFDATRRVDPEDLELISKMVSKMIKEENGEEE